MTRARSLTRLTRPASGPVSSPALAALVLLFAVRASAADLTFAPAVAYRAANTSPVVADVNNDGALDVLLLHGTRSGVTITELLGNGDGTLQAATTIATTPALPSAFRVADVNKDGRADLVVLTSTGTQAQVGVMLGHGDGTFAAPIMGPAVSGFGSAMDVGDLNGDGRPDIVITRQDGPSNYVDAFLVDGSGHPGAPVESMFSGAVPFGMLPPPSLPTDVRIADFDGDGHMDVAIFDVADGSLWNVFYTMPGIGNGAFGTPMSHAFGPIAGGSGATGFTVGDVTGDGVPDVIVTGLSSGQIAVLHSDGNAQFEDPILTTVDSVHMLAIGDLDGDGLPDLVVDHWGTSVGSSSYAPSPVVSVLLGHGDGTFETPAIDFTAQSSGGVALGDLNHDGKLDIVSANGVDAIWVLLSVSASLDTTPPVLHTPTAPTAEATGPSGAAVSFSVTATDPDDTAGDVSCTPASATTFALGTTTVNCQATDTHGNTGTASFTVTVQDTTPPALQDVPHDIATEATGPHGAAVTFSMPTASDLVDGAVAVSCSPASGATFPVGATTVSCSATDAHGNTASQSFVVTVRDTTPPTLHGVPADMVVEATGPGGAAAMFTAPTATDLVDGTVTVSCSPASGALFALGTSTVKCSATDAHGNTVSASFTVTVQDTTPPVLQNVIGGIVVDAIGPAGAPVTYPAPTAVDLVDGSVPVVCTPPSGAIFPIGDHTITCTATDAHHNSAAATIAVHVRGAAEMLAALQAYVSGIGPGRSLLAKVNAAIAALASGNPGGAASTLEALAHEATAQSGKSLTPAQSAYIVASVTRIVAILGY